MGPPLSACCQKWKVLKAQRLYSTCCRSCMQSMDSKNREYAVVLQSSLQTDPRLCWTVCLHCVCRVTATANCREFMDLHMTDAACHHRLSGHLLPDVHYAETT